MIAPRSRWCSSGVGSVAAQVIELCSLTWGTLNTVSMAALLVFCVHGGSVALRLAFFQKLKFLGVADHDCAFRC